MVLPQPCGTGAPSASASGTTSLPVSIVMACAFAAIRAASAEPSRRRIVTGTVTALLAGSRSILVKSGVISKSGSSGTLMVRSRASISPWLR